MSNFDPTRIGGKVANKIFTTLYKPDHISIQKALANDLVEKETELFVVKVDAENVIAFSKELMGYHHFAEGYLNKKPYILTFCSICNSGMVFNPEVNQKMLYFEVAGVYNGMVMMTDRDTGSYWDHITGECLHGQHKGVQLEVLHSHLVLTAEELSTNYPNSLYAVAKMNFLQRFFSKIQDKKSSTKGNGFLPPFFRKSMLKKDTRFPEMEMGLGIWEEQDLAKFYAIKKIKERGGQFIESFNNQSLLIYIAPLNGTPNAIYIPNGLTASWKEDTLVLSNGSYIRSGKFFSNENEELKINEPGQMFSRWYGFIATFPNCSISI
jgi:hypothetical protein